MPDCLAAILQTVEQPATVFEMNNRKLAAMIANDDTVIRGQPQAVNRIQRHLDSERLSATTL